MNSLQEDFENAQQIRNLRQSRADELVGRIAKDTHSRTNPSELADGEGKNSRGSIERQTGNGENHGGAGGSGDGNKRFGLYEFLEKAIQSEMDSNGVTSDVTYDGVSGTRRVYLSGLVNARNIVNDEVIERAKALGLERAWENLCSIMGRLKTASSLPPEGGDFSVVSGDCGAVRKVANDSLERREVGSKPLPLDVNVTGFDFLTSDICNVKVTDLLFSEQAAEDSGYLQKAGAEARFGRMQHGDTAIWEKRRLMIRGRREFSRGYLSNCFETLSMAKGEYLERLWERGVYTITEDQVNEAVATITKRPESYDSGKSRVMFCNEDELLDHITDRSKGSLFNPGSLESDDMDKKGRYCIPVTANQLENAKWVAGVLSWLVIGREDGLERSEFDHSSRLMPAAKTLNEIVFVLLGGQRGKIAVGRTVAITPNVWWKASDVFKAICRRARGFSDERDSGVYNLNDYMQAISIWGSNVLQWSRPLTREEQLANGDATIRNVFHKWWECGGRPGKGGRDSMTTIVLYYSPFWVRWAYRNHYLDLNGELLPVQLVVPGVRILECARVFASSWGAIIDALGQASGVPLSMKGPSWRDQRRKNMILNNVAKSAARYLVTSDREGLGHFSNSGAATLGALAISGWDCYEESAAYNWRETSFSCGDIDQGMTLMLRAVWAQTTSNLWAKLNLSIIDIEEYIEVKFGREPENRGLTIDGMGYFKERSERMLKENVIVGALWSWKRKDRDHWLRVGNYRTNESLVVEQLRFCRDDEDIALPVLLPRKSHGVPLSYRVNCKVEEIGNISVDMAATKLIINNGHFVGGRMSFWTPDDDLSFA